jgi:hypothetical protein
MGMRHITSSIIAAAVLAGLVPGAATPASAAVTAAASSRDQLAPATAAWRDLAGGRSGLGEVSVSGTVQAAAPNDAVSYADANDVAEARGDVLQVGVGSVANGGLVFTMTIEGLSVLVGNEQAISFWGVDTSGDAEPDVVVALVRTAAAAIGLVFDEPSGSYLCDAIGGAVANTLAVQVNPSGCFGDVKRPAVGAFLVFTNGSGGQQLDFAPDGAGLVRFNRPPTGPSGGYAVVSRSAPGSDPTFRRFGAIPTYQCGDACPVPAKTVITAGPFDDYIGPGRLVGTASARPFDPALWGVTDDGEVVTAGDAEYYGDATNIALARPIVGMAVRPDRSGYWLVASDGGIFSYGDAPFYGSTGGTRLNQPIVGMASTPTGDGYWLVASDGGIFNYGDAAFLGSTGGITLNRPVVGMAGGRTAGYWLVASDGGIFSYGVPFHGSTGSIALQQPIVGMAVTRSGGGYRFIARDGGVFSYGDAEFHGSGAAPGRTDVIGLATA